MQSLKFQNYNSKFHLIRKGKSVPFKESLVDVLMILVKINQLEKLWTKVYITNLKSFWKN